MTDKLNAPSQELQNEAIKQAYKTGVIDTLEFAHKHATIIADCFANILKDMKGEK